MRYICSFTLFMCSICSLFACSSSDKISIDTDLKSPSSLNIERSGSNITMYWSDNSDNETGFIISRKETYTETETEIGKVNANVTDYTITSGLEEGKSYTFSVKAYSTKGESYPVSLTYKYLSNSQIPIFSISNAKANSTCFYTYYQLNNVTVGNDMKYGLCWSSDKTPTVRDQIEYGPSSYAGNTVLQVIPNVFLDYGKSYRIRPFIVSSGGTYYGSEFTLSLENEYPAINLSWTKLAKSSLPSEIELYETTSQLSGHTFHAWYAIADLSTGKVEFRVNIPTKPTTIDDQLASFNGKCYLMTNGGYFYNGTHIGLGVVNSNISGNISTVRGSLKTADSEYGVLYYVTRAAFGIDHSDKPAVYWAATGDDNKTMYFFDRPLPTVKGEAKYSAITSTNPAKAINWSPKYALSGGPVLLKNGKIPFDFTNTTKGTDFYLSNYEIMPYDIFGPDVSPDRTAIGYRSDGKIILFICDGRIAASRGATLLELAQIMKGLGCVEAINLDGGGSTGMALSGEHLNDTTAGNRAVVSTVGFFKKE